MLAWYFSKADKKLQHGDGRQIVKGRTHKVACKLVLCSHGLHASQRPIDALQYAPGPILWRVRLGGEILTSDDKLCASERTYLWGFDATDILREFARKCALAVYPMWGNPQADPDGVVKRYLETGDETIRAAAWAAARAAAWGAARDAAWAAARAAAGAAAWEAARAAAWDAAGAAQNRRLLAMIRKARP